MSDFSGPRFEATSTNPNAPSTAKAMDIIRKRQLVSGVGDNVSPVGEPGVPSEAPPTPPPAAEPQPQEQKAPPRQEPAAKEEGEGDQRVPLKRLNEVIKQRDTNAGELAKLQADIATLQKENSDAKRQASLDALRRGTDRPKGWDEMPSDQQQLWLMEKFSEFQPEAPKSQPEGDSPKSAEWIAKLELMETEGFNFQQAGVVSKLKGENPNLTTEQAVTLAQVDQPDLFSGGGSSEDVPSVPVSHAVSAPRSTSGAPVQASQDPVSEARQKAGEANTPRERQLAGVALIKALRAQAVPR